MKRNVSLVIIALGLGLAWFIGFTDQGQGMGRDFIVWFREIFVSR